ncbi:MAG: hypothetical protein OEZ22_04705 [Spirochaetia bacterium]|nr:hypothetical protein [Spirochaetia bacterium]
MKNINDKVFFVMFPVLLLVYLLSSDVSLAESNLLLSKEERLALKREMIEMDIDIRNLASMISMGNINEIRRIFYTSSSIRTFQINEHKDGIKRAIKKIRGRGLLSYLLNINNESLKMYNYINDNIKEKKEINWEVIKSSYNRMIENCRYCHLKTLPDSYRE